VVITNCGLGALSDVAAARKPAVLLPQPRPHDEQAFTARALARAGLGIVLDQPAGSWPDVLDRAVRSDSTRWPQWSPGHAAADAAAVIVEVARAA
jgi:UDP-N-acetylglucosamine:LPS N-acetylglucosamine transferase